MNIATAMTLIAAMDADGVTLTDLGASTAMDILFDRVGWTPAHARMFNRLGDGEMKVPLKLERLVTNTPLADALHTARKFNRTHLKNQRRKLHRKAREMRECA